VLTASAEREAELRRASLRPVPGGPDREIA